MATLSLKLHYPMQFKNLAQEVGNPPGFDFRPPTPLMVCNKGKEENKNWEQQTYYLLGRIMSFNASEDGPVSLGLVTIDPTQLAASIFEMTVKPYYSISRTLTAERKFTLTVRDALFAVAQKVDDQEEESWWVREKEPRSAKAVVTYDKNRPYFSNPEGFSLSFVLDGNT